MSRVALVALLGLASAPLFAGGPGAGDPVPELRLVTLEGDPYDLADLRGRVVVAKFGFTW